MCEDEGDPKESRLSSGSSCAGTVLVLFMARKTVDTLMSTNGKAGKLPCCAHHIAHPQGSWHALGVINSRSACTCSLKAHPELRCAPRFCWVPWLYRGQNKSKAEQQEAEFRARAVGRGLFGIQAQPTSCRWWCRWRRCTGSGGVPLRNEL